MAKKWSLFLCVLTSSFVRSMICCMIICGNLRTNGFMVQFSGQKFGRVMIVAVVSSTSILNETKDSVDGSLFRGIRAEIFTFVSSEIPLDVRKSLMV